MRRILDKDERERWWTLGGVEVLDVMGTVQRLLRRGQVVHIGTDAQKSTNRMEFVTVAVRSESGQRRSRLLYAPP